MNPASLYLRGDEVKYWDIPIVMGKERCIGKLLEHILFPIVEVYWEPGAAGDALITS